MTDEPAAAAFTAGPWADDGAAPVQATGSDARAALEAALRGLRALVLPGEASSSGKSRAAPLRGEGDDLGQLFAAIAADLLDQLALCGSGVEEVTVDGVLQRSDGGFIAWGYAHGSLEGDLPGPIPTLCDPQAERTPAGHVTLRATFRPDPRPPTPDT
jgi:hypothetical protein